jgi:hypothetical protein
MLHKANAACRHHIPELKRRVLNWTEYDASLRQQGSLTVWVSDEAIAHRKSVPRITPGGQPTLRANEDETSAPRKFKLEGVGNLFRGHAQQDAPASR